MSRAIYYWDKVEKKMIEGYPPPNFDRFGDAPMVIQDSITPYKHPASGIWVESRKALSEMDKATGTITQDKIVKADPRRDIEREKILDADRKQALHQAVERIRNGTAPLTDEMKAVCKIENEKIKHQGGEHIIKQAKKLIKRRK